MKSKQFDLNRREFFRKGLFGAAALCCGSLLSSSLARAADPQPKVVSEDEPMAKAMGYKKDATKVDDKKFPKRAGADGKKQLCNNCIFYAPTAGTQGKCQILSNNLVEAKGWCNSWTAKPA